MPETLHPSHWNARPGVPETSEELKPVAWAYYYDGQLESNDHPILSVARSSSDHMRREPWTEVALYAHPAPTAAHPAPTAADEHANNAYDPTIQPFDEPFRHVAAADTGGQVERLTVERDKWEETAKYSEKRVAFWQAKEAAAREQIAELERENTEVGQEAFTLRNSLQSAESSSANWHRLHDKQDAGREAAEASLSSAHETIRAMREALGKIAQEPSCGCVPCTGQCRSQEALQITLDAIRDLARAALTLAKEMPDGQ